MAKRLTRNELEERLKMAQSYGATPEQIEQKRKEYQQSGMIKTSKSPLVNLVADLGRAVVKPVADYGRLVGEAGRQVGNVLNPEYQGISRRIKTGQATPEELKKFETMSAPKFMRQKDVEAVGGDVAKGAFYGGKKGVGAAVTVAPFVAPHMAGGAILGKAGTLKQAVGQGTALGAGRGFGGDTLDVGQTLAETVTGGIAGGVTSGAMYGLGKAGQALKEKAKAEPLPNLKGTALKKDPFFSSTKVEQDSVASEVGLSKRATPFQNTEKLEAGFKTYDGEVTRVLKENNWEFTQGEKNKIIKAFKDYVIESTDMDIGTKGNKEFISRMAERVSKARTPEDLSALKTWLRKDINFDGMGSMKKEAKKGLFRLIQGALDDVDPNIRILNNKERALFDIAEEVVGGFQKDAQVGLSVPFTKGLDVNLPVTSGQLDAGTHRAMGAVGAIPKAILQGVGSVAGQDLPRQVASGTMAGVALGDTMPDLDAPRPTTPLQGLERDIGGAQQMQGPISYFEAAQIAQTQGPEAVDNMWVVHPEGKAIWNPIQKTWMAYNPEMFSGTAGRGDLRESEQKVANAKMSMDALLQDLESGRLDVSPGPIASRMQSAGAVVGAADPEFLEYKQRLQTATIALRNAMLGAQMTPQELKRFELPDPNEPLATALPKLRAVSAELERWLR
jgi:hypothetical protein